MDDYHIVCPTVPRLDVLPWRRWRPETRNNEENPPELWFDLIVHRVSSLKEHATRPRARHGGPLEPIAGSQEDLPGPGHMYRAVVFSFFPFDTSAGHDRGAYMCKQGEGANRRLVAFGCTPQEVGGRR